MGSFFTKYGTVIAVGAALGIVTGCIRRNMVKDEIERFNKENRLMESEKTTEAKPA